VTRTPHQRLADFEAKHGDYATLAKAYYDALRDAMVVDPSWDYIRDRTFLQKDLLDNHTHLVWICMGYDLGRADTLAEHDIREDS
jgi:hypothetical protein